MAITAASLMVKVGADTTPAQRALSSFSRSLGNTLNQGARQADQFSAQFNRAISGINTGVLQGLAGGLAGGISFGAFNAGLNAVVGTVQGVVSEAANAYIETERLTMSLKAMSAQELVNAGSAKNFSEGLAMAGDRANELLGWIQDLAIESPFGSQDIAGVMRLGMVYGFNSEQAKRSTKAISDFGAAMGLTGPEMERVVRALGQMNQRGKVTSQELMQLSEVGVGGLQILADAAGVSAAEMQKMIENGVVPAGPAIEALIAKFEEYDGAASANAGTLGGLVASVQDLKDIGMVELFGPAFEAITPAVSDLVDGMKSPEFRAGLNAIGEQIGVFAGEGVKAGADAIAAAVKLFQESSTMSTPEWLATVAGLVGVNVQVNPKLPEGYTLEVPTNAPTTPKIVPGLPPLDVPAQGQLISVFLDPAQDYGVSVDTKANVTTIDMQGVEDKDGFKLTVDAKAKVTKLEVEVPGRSKGSDDTWEIMFTADWKQGTLGSLLAAAMDPLGGWKFLLDAGWKPEVLGNMWTAAASVFGVGFPVSAIWTAGILIDLRSEMQNEFNEPIMLAGSWLSGTLETLWDSVSTFFSTNPISVATGLAGSPEVTSARQQINQNMGELGLPGYQPKSIYGFASGTKSAPGGLALVGEEGPELVVLPRGAQVIPNDKTMRMIPGFAEGTPGAASPFGGLSSSFGNVGDLAGQSAAKAIKDAAKDLSKSLKEVIGDLEDAIRSTPGVFGTSKVTADQMRMAELGVPQQFGDDYLRRLTDEVINGVDWQGVDIKEAAAAAGIDPNLPAQAILEMFRSAWSDSSLFANPENLRFINQDAIKAQMERQQASEAGQSNIMALFGIGDEQLVNEIAGLGLEISTGLQTYLGEQGMGPVGAQAAAGIGTGIAENGAPMGAGMTTGFMNWMTSPDGLTAIAGMGDGLVANLNQAFKRYAPGYDWTVPAGQGQPAPEGTTTPPGFASGTSWYRGGLALVGEQGPELVRLPMGSSVLNASETAAAMGGVNVVVNAAVSQPHDIELLARRVARMIQQKRGR